MSPLRFQKCVERGYTSALQLAAFASNVEVSSLKTYYEQSVEALWFQKRRHAPEFEAEGNPDDEHAIAAVDSESDDETSAPAKKSAWLGL